MSRDHSVARSMELYERAGERIPGWVQLISRRAERFTVPDADLGIRVTGLPDADVQVYDLSASISGSTHPEPVLLTGVTIEGWSGDRAPVPEP